MIFCKDLSISFNSQQKFLFGTVVPPHHHTNGGLEHDFSVQIWIFHSICKKKLFYNWPQSPGVGVYIFWKLTLPTSLGWGLANMISFQIWTFHATPSKNWELHKDPLYRGFTKCLEAPRGFVKHLCICKKKAKYVYVCVCIYVCAKSQAAFAKHTLYK